MANEKKELGVATGEATAKPMSAGPNSLVSQREFIAHGPAQLEATRTMYRVRGEQNARAITNYPDWRSTKIEGE